MILLHEQMREEAAHLAGLIKEVFAIPVRILEDGLERFFVSLPKVDGYYYIPKIELLIQEFPGAAIFLLTKRDIYYGDTDKDNQWAFGATPEDGPFFVAATARLMGIDSRPRTSLGIDHELFLQRLSYLTIHELGHKLIKDAPHHENAFWVNIRQKTSDRLGPHCDDSTCAMYEVVDIVAPAKDEGYLKLGDSCLYDAGLNEQLARLRADWYCARCRNHIFIPDSYRITDF